MVRAQKLSYAIKDKTILHPLQFEIEKGSFTTIIGPNGAGKSTLIHLLAGGTSNYSGAIFLGQKNITEYPTITLAQKRAVLAQQNNIQFPIDVMQVVQLGRQPYLQQETPLASQEAIDFGIETWNIQDLRHRKYQSLSGGERQKVQFARIWTQLYTNDYSEKILFIDEPLTYLDIYHQLDFMKKIDQLHQKGLTIIGVFHQLDIALQHSENIIVLDNGQISFSGNKSTILERKILEKTFHVSAYTTQTSKHHHIMFELPDAEK